VNEINEKDYRKVREKMQTYHDPPKTPIEEMWPAIQASWKNQAGKRQVAAIRKRWVGRGLAAAAMITLGVALGRMSAVQSPATPAVANGPVVEEEGGVSTTYRLAASRHFDQSEMLLMLFENDPAQDDFIPLARNLLTTTRLLLDSRAADDPRINAMLLDLELVFSQLVHIQPGNDIVEREMITDNVQGSTLLPRLRSLIYTPRS
jgi:hypothetical protein